MGSKLGIDDGLGPARRRARDRRPRLAGRSTVMAVTLPTVRSFRVRLAPAARFSRHCPQPRPGEENDGPGASTTQGDGRMTPDAHEPGTEDGGRLRDHEVVEQLMAADAVLIALGRSSADPDAVLDTVAESARRLCRCQGVQIYLLHGDEFELAASVGLSPEFERYVAQHPLRRDRETMAGRVALDRRIHQVTDVLSDPGYGRRDVQEIGGYRTLIAAPLILDDEVVGAISLWRTKVEPFDDRATAMLEAFAAQAAAVVRNVHLVRALEARRVELARKVEQLQALSEVGETVSSTLVLDDVLFKIILNAVRFAECDGGSIMEYVEADRCFLARTTYPSSPELLSGLRTTQDPAGPDSGRAGGARRAPDRDIRHRAGRAGRPPAAAVRGRLAVCPGRAGAPRRPDHRRHGGPAQDNRRASPTRSWSSWRRSRASRRSRCSMPACSTSSSARAPSWRWRASTSRTFSPACRTS